MSDIFPSLIGDKQSPLSLVEKVDALEKSFMQIPQVACPVIHRFGPGTYIREVTIPAGTLAIGHHQNFEHTNVLLKGRVTILSDDGTPIEFRAPMIFVGKPGRKIGFIHEEMVWLNIYSTSETDVEKLEDYFLTKSIGFKENASILERRNIIQSRVDLNDYLEMLKEVGFSEEQVRAQSENTDDQVPLPHGGYKIKVAKSAIQGQGLFATANIEPGEIIAPARINSMRTIAGRFTNHSASPNAQMVGTSDIDLMAIKPISGCHGGLDGDEITVDYRQALSVNLKIGGFKCQG